MSIRRAQSIPPEEKPPKNRCVQLLCVGWKVFTCVFSHVTLVTSVVAYCILGAYTFEHLEKDNEIQVRLSKFLFLNKMSEYLNNQVKLGISSLRLNVTEEIWKLTTNMPVLFEEVWTNETRKRLQVIFTNFSGISMKENLS